MSAAQRATVAQQMKQKIFQKTLNAKWKAEKILKNIFSAKQLRNGFVENKTAVAHKKALS